MQKKHLINLCFIFILSTASVLATIPATAQPEHVYTCEGDLKTADEMQYCSAKTQGYFELELKKVYAKVRKHTQAKSELDNAQKAWIKYRDLQCSNYWATETRHSPAYTLYASGCETILTEQRVQYLKSLLD